METENKFKFGLVGIGVTLFLGLWFLFSTFRTVQAGRVGVLTTFGKITGTLQPGLHIVAPFGIQGVENMDTKILKGEVKAEAGSKDLQTVNTDIVVNYHIKADKATEIYQKIGNNDIVEKNIVFPAVSEVVKASVAQKNAEEILTKRPELKADIDTKLHERLLTYDVVVDDVSIVNVDFSKEFNAAIEAKQVADQRAQQSVFIAKQAENDATAAINKAKGEAASQQLVQQTLTPELLQKLWIEKWNGVLPTYTGANAPTAFLGIK